MKTVKSLEILIIGLITALILYPFFHELGHTLATLVVEGKILEFHIFPMPNVLCDMRNVSETGSVVIGLSGTILPYIISRFFTPKNFVVWYIQQMLRLISAISCGISIYAIIAISWFGKSIPNEDVTTILRIWPQGKLVCLFLFVCILLNCLILIAQEQPVSKIEQYYGI